MSANSSYIYHGFKMKEFEKLPNPEWPKVIEFMANTKVQVYGFSNSKIDHKSFEVFQVAIGKNPVGKVCLSTLNLSMNNLT